MAKNMQIDIDNESNIYPYYQVPNHVQEKLKSGENLKTVNEESLLGQGNMDIGGGGAGVEYITYGDAEGYAKIVAALEEGKIPVVTRNNGAEVYSFDGLHDGYYEFTKVSIDTTDDKAIGAATVRCAIGTGTWSIRSTTLPKTSDLEAVVAAGSPVPMLDVMSDDGSAATIHYIDIMDRGKELGRVTKNGTEYITKCVDVFIPIFNNGCFYAWPLIQFQLSHYAAENNNVRCTIDKYIPIIRTDFYGSGSLQPQYVTPEDGINTQYGGTFDSYDHYYKFDFSIAGDGNIAMILRVYLTYTEDGLHTYYKITSAC